MSHYGETTNVVKKLTSHIEELCKGINSFETSQTTFGGENPEVVQTIGSIGYRQQKVANTFSYTFLKPLCTSIDSVGIAYIQLWVLFFNPFPYTFLNLLRNTFLKYNRATGHTR